MLYAHIRIGYPYRPSLSIAYPHLLHFTLIIYSGQVKTKTRPFADKIKLQEMLELRGNGWSLPALARRYNVYDHAAIQYHCKRHGVYLGHENKKNLKVFYHSRQPVIRNIIATVLVWWLPETERVNPGKTYKEYVQEYNAKHADHPLSIPNPSLYVDLPTIRLHENDIRSSTFS